MAQWELGHKPLGAYAATRVQVEADTSWDAITTVREGLDDSEIVAFIRRLD